MAHLEILGHRGARGEAPENTLTSFLRASDAGVHGIELDVRMSLDGVLYAFHDKTVRRTTLQNSQLLTQLDARHALSHWPHQEAIPSLESVLIECPSHLHYQLEIKGFMPMPYLDALVLQLKTLITT